MEPVDVETSEVTGFWQPSISTSPYTSFPPFNSSSDSEIEDKNVMEGEVGEGISPHTDVLDAGKAVSNESTIHLPPSVDLSTSSTVHESLKEENTRLRAMLADAKMIITSLRDNICADEGDDDRRLRNRALDTAVRAEVGVLKHRVAQGAKENGVLRKQNERLLGRLRECEGVAREAVGEARRLRVEMEGVRRKRNEEGGGGGGGKGRRRGSRTKEREREREMDREREKEREKEKVKERQRERERERENQLPPPAPPKKQSVTEPSVVNVSSEVEGGGWVDLKEGTIKIRMSWPSSEGVQTGGVRKEERRGREEKSEIEREGNERVIEGGEEVMSR